MKVETLTNLFDSYGKDISFDADNVKYGYYYKDEELDIEYEKIIKSLSLMTNLREYMTGGKESILDNECTDHMIKGKVTFHDITPNHGQRRYVTFDDNSKGKVFGLGN